MLRRITLWYLFKWHDIKPRWVALTPYGFWHLTEYVFDTPKYTTKTLNTLLLLPIPILNVGALFMLFIRYTYVKIKILRVMGCSDLLSLIAILPISFDVYILKGYVVYAKQFGNNASTVEKPVQAKDVVCS